tara:strand:+ start:368 stop:589 length:222 start_codon:yes stop_codon:yes gene_type:complete
MLCLAGNSTGVAANAVAVVNHETIVQRSLLKFLLLDKLKLSQLISFIYFLELENSNTRYNLLFLFVFVYIQKN